MKKFKHLNVPSHWEHYWSKYPEGYTILESLLNWVNQVDDMVDNVNGWNKYLEKFVDTFDDKLKPHVRDFLREMETDGRLADIINGEIFQDINDDIAKNTERIENFYVSVSDYGAYGESSDDSDAIQQAIDAVGERGGGTVLFTYGTDYQITKQITQPYDNVILKGTGARIVYDGTAGTAVKLGKDTGNTRRVGFIDLQIINKSLAWGHDITGLEVTSLVWSTLENIEVEGFKTNMLLNSFKGGCAYNEIHLRRLFDGERNLVIDPQGVNGWVNENSFYGGNFSVSSSRTALEREPAINCLVTAGTNAVVNNNRFYSPCFEGNDVKAIECHGRYTVFYSPRFENSLEVELLGSSNTIFHGRGLRRNYVRLSPNSQIFNNEGIKLRGATFTDDEGVIDSRNGSSAAFPTYVGRNPLGDITFSVDGSGNIKANSIDVATQTKGEGEFTEVAVEHLRMNDYSSSIIGPGERIIRWQINPPDFTAPIGSLVIVTGGGPVLWVKAELGADGWVALAQEV